MRGPLTRIHLDGAVERTPGVVDPTGSLVAMTEVRKQAGVGRLFFDRGRESDRRQINLIAIHVIQSQQRPAAHAIHTVTSGRITSRRHRRFVVQPRCEEHFGLKKSSVLSLRSVSRNRRILIDEVFFRLVEMWEGGGEVAAPPVEIDQVPGALVCIFMRLDNIQQRLIALRRGHFGTSQYC